MHYKLACVQYANAAPLVEALRGDPSIELIFDVPSALPALLESGRADAILVSSIYGLQQPGVRLALASCIGSSRAVESVRLFSKVPPGEIRSLVLDSSSMTSNRLAQIWLADVHGVRPALSSAPPDLGAMLADADAAILIGDAGMQDVSHDLFVVDLGLAWFEWTGFPFLWAGWFVREKLDERLVGILNSASSFVRTPEFVSRVAALHGIEPARLARYYDVTMRFGLDEELLAGYREFSSRIAACGFTDCPHFPALVSGG